jgi:thymidylate synthase (FAD)
MDPLFRVELIAATPNPQTCIYAALHQDYCEDFVCDTALTWPNEARCGEIAIKRLLDGNRNHFGCLEHPQITLNCGYFPHTVMQQARTHRVACSFDVQSGRYTSQRVIDVVEGKRSIEEVFYLRPVGRYTDRKGAKYEYGEEQRLCETWVCLEAAKRFADSVRSGMAEEHARELLPYAIRQHFVVSFNLRSAMHFMDLRAKKDAQLEIQQLSELIWREVKLWVPELAEWYEQNRMYKARLAP